MMSREDILRELELLPVWQLRTPAPKITIDEKPVQLIVAEKRVVTEPAVEVVTEKVTEELVTEAVQATHQFRLIMSKDGQWAFVLAPQQSEESEVLLQNMIKAVSLSVGQDIVDANTAHLNQHAPKVIVVMGEAEAQLLLNEKQALEDLRGKTHQYQGAPVIATYTPAYLLKNLGDKAKAWEDLCLSKFTIASL